MVDHDISINANPKSVAAFCHVWEVSFISRSSHEFVGDWLVALPPRPIWHNQVFVGGRDLNASKTVGGKEVFTLLSNVRPLPLTKVNYWLNGQSILQPFQLQQVNNSRSTITDVWVELSVSEGDETENSHNELHLFPTSADFSSDKNKTGASVWPEAAYIAACY